MNFVAGALLLACANQDPAVSEQPERVDDNFSETARKVDAEGVGRDSPAESEPGSSWEDSDDIDGTGGDARQVRSYCVCHIKHCKCGRGGLMADR